MQGEQHHTECGNHEVGEETRESGRIPPRDQTPISDAVAKYDNNNSIDMYEEKFPIVYFVEESKKRRINLTRSDERDFGFTLRHFIVYPPNEADDRLDVEDALFLNYNHPLDTIFVIYVRKGSPAYFAGLNTGDRILSVNAIGVEDHSYQEIVSIIQTSQATLHLVVVPKENDIIQQAYIQAAHNPESNLNVRFQTSPELFGTFSCASSWSSHSSLSSYPMPSPISYQSPTHKPSSFSIVPPRNPPKPLVPPFAPVSRISPTPRPVLPSHRKGPIPLTKARVASPSRQGGSQNGPRSHSSSSHQSKRKPHSGGNKDSNKKRSPMVVDRKQAVYATNNNLRKSASDQYLENKSSEKNTSSPSNSSVVIKSQKQNTSSDMYQPPKTKERDQNRNRDSNELLPGMVHTKIVEVGTYGKENTKVVGNRVGLPVVKSNTDVSIPNLSSRRDSSQYTSKLFSYPSKAVKVDVRKGDDSYSSDFFKDSSSNYSNKENIAKNLNSSPYVPDRSTQEVIERMKKNFEKKDEFLKRPNQPLWRPVSPIPTPLREYHVSPQKLQRHLWPPPPTQLPPTEGALSKAFSCALGGKHHSHVLRRTKSAVEEPRTVSFPSTETRSYEPYAEGLYNSLPSSPTTLSNGTINHLIFSSPIVSTALYATLPGPANPLTGNLVAKPYGTHLNEDITHVSKVNKPFVSTLSRIQENIPSSCQDLTPSTLSLIQSYPTTPSNTPFGGSTSSLITTNSITKTIPFAWIGDNERIKQLQIVSTRAKKFESLNSNKNDSKTTTQKLELSRLSQRDDSLNVANKRKEFERREGDAGWNSSLSFELGTSFDCSTRLKKFEDANWKGTKGVVKSLSDGGEFFAASREYFSLPEVSSSTSITSTDQVNIQGTGNRMIPVGGPKIHCEPPDSQISKQNRPLNNSDLFERNRINSTWSHDLFWPSAGEADEETRKRTSSPLLRQHSFHSTLQSHLALAEVPEPNIPQVSHSSGGLVAPPDYPKEKGAAWPQLTGSTAPRPPRPERPTFLALESRSRPFEGAPPPSSTSSCSPIQHHHHHHYLHHQIHHSLRCMPQPSVSRDQGAVASIQHRIASSAADGSGSAAVTSSGAQVTAGVSRRNKHLYGEDHDRLVRRVSYLKATSGDRIYSDSEADSEEEKSLSAISPACLARRAIGQITPSEDLPSPGSFLSSVTSSGALQVKIAKLHGKRAGDRSWKSVWAVIQGRALLLYKDKSHAAQTPLSPEDQVSLRGVDAGVASDYTKRRHVFRLTTPAGSQFLLQADSEPAMTAWLNSITAAASQDVEPHLKAMTPTPDNDAVNPSYLDTPLGPPMATTPNATASGSLYPPPSEITTGSESNTSPQLAPKHAKKITSPLKSKASTGVPTYIKSRKSTHGDLGSSPKSKTWKGRIGRHLRKMQGTSSLTPPSVPLPEGASIGVCLEDCPPSEDNEFVPLLVSLCVGVVETRGLHIQGIYRIPGNRAAVTHLIETVNRGPNAIDLTDTRWSDVNVISSLLKQFFQRLPDPLIPSDLYPHFIEASKIDDPQQRLLEIRNLLQDLPDHHYETLHYLCLHLNHVVSNSNDNKMDVRNLAIVFGPTLVRAADDNMAKMVTDMSHQCRIVEILISHANWFFSEEESDEPPPIITSPGALNPLASDLSNSHAAEMEASSQSLLLGNVQKLEATQRDPKKLLVSSIISAANRRVQKARKKLEEDNASSVSESNPPLGGTYDDMLGHVPEQQETLPLAQRRVPSIDTSHFANGNRDGRLFEDNVNPLLARDDKLDSFGSFSNYGNQHAINNPYSTGTFSTTKPSVVSSTASGGGLSASTLSKSEPSYFGGEDLPIRSYTGLSASTQERIRRFEMETRAMLKRDITRHRREVLDKQKLEEELQKAKKDLETEDIFDKLADNPSQVMHMMNDYCWAPNREAVSLPSLRHSVPSDSLKSHLAKSSPVPTNASAKDEKLDHTDLMLNHPRPNHEGSDLLNAINATFEKMKSLQPDSSLLGTGDSRRDGGSCSSRTSSPSDGFRRKDSGSSHSSSSSSGGGTKCKLYRDPSLHRRRTLNAAMTQPSSDVAATNDFSNQKFDSGSLIGECDAKDTGTDLDVGSKEKSEKRSRDLTRTETHESLREKRPKELKRSGFEDPFLGDQSRSASVIVTSSRREKRDSSEIRSRKHNVKELKEKFERSSPPPPLHVGSGPGVPGIPPIKNASTPNGEKTTRSSIKAARKARIKRRHTVGGMKDLARVAWLKVIEAAHYADPLKANPGCQVTTETGQLPTWDQLQMFLEAFAEGRKLNVDTQSFNALVSREKLGTSTPDLDSILSLVLPPQQKEALKRRLSVREPSMKPLHPVLESNV